MAKNWWSDAPVYKPKTPKASGGKWWASAPKAETAKKKPKSATFLDKLGYLGQGVNQGLEQFGQGVTQFEKGLLNKVGLLEDEDVSEFEKQVRQDRAKFGMSPAGKSGYGTAGKFVGETLPAFALPGGAAGSLLKRAAVTAGQGALAGGAQYVPEGGSRLRNAAVGTVGGAFPIAGAAPGAALALGKRAFRGSPAKMQETIKTFERAGTTPSIGEASGRWTTQGLESLGGGFPGSAGRMAKVSSRQQEQIQKKFGDIGKGISPRAESTTAGLGIQRGIQRFADTFQKKAGKLYDALDKYVPQDAPTPADNLVATLRGAVGRPDDLAASIKSTGLKPMLQKVEALREKNGGVLPYGELKNLRTAIGQKLGSPELDTNIDRRDLGNVYGALSDDMRELAIANGDEAGARAFDRANKFYMGGKKRIGNFLTGLSKKVEPEKVYKAAIGDIADGPTKLRAIKKSLNKDEWNAVAGTVLKRLGQATPGQQNADTTAFNTANFLTNWSRVNPKARKELFSGTPELRRYQKDIQAIADTANVLKQSDKALANPSGTGARATWAIGIMLAPFSLGTSSAGANAAARLMTYPRFVNWMAKSAKESNQRGAVSNALGKLTAIQTASDVNTAAAIEEYKKMLMAQGQGNQQQPM